MNVGLTDAELAARPSSGARGRLTAREALRRILKGTGATFIRIDARSLRIVRRGEPRAPAPPATAEPANAAAMPPLEHPDIIVTASKQNIRLGNYAGSAIILRFDPDQLGQEAAQGSAALVGKLPVLLSTNLGPGRNKLFLRGIADSSFNGSTPATVGQYLGDVRLTYNAPDPNLNLYDMSGAEVLEGPQGTLYGTGALGGIIRLLPNPPDAGRNAASISMGGVSASHGGEGYDAAGMANIVILPGRAALRTVAYGALEPGYIDDPSRGLKDVNRTRSRGGRIALLFRPQDEWSITLGGAMQNISTRDGQYVLRGSSRLERSTLLAQPFDNDYGLAYLTATRTVGSSDLTSTTSIVRHDVDNIFDATLAGGPPRRFAESLEIRLVSHETRLSHQSAKGNWIVGVSGLVARGRTVRMLGDPDDPQPITGVRNVNNEVALFGQYSRHLNRRLTMAAGARLSYAHGSGELLDEVSGDPDEPSRTQLRISPTLSLAWQLNDKLIAYVHGQSAFRPGLLQVGPTDGSSAAQRIEPDTLTMIEAGLRYGTSRRDPVTLSASVAASRWADIQSDLIDSDGLPFTTNIGDGRILTLELQGAWRISPALAIEAGIFLNNSRLTDPSAKLIDADKGELPNIPHVVARLSANYSKHLDPRTEMTLTAGARYTGSSELGIGAPLNVSQGNYLETSIGARLSRGAMALSLDVSNLGDARGNRFSFGNPFSLEQGNQTTPMVPRRLRLGLDFQF